MARKGKKFEQAEANFNFSNVKINLFLTPLNYLAVFLLCSHFKMGLKLPFITNRYHATALYSCLIYIWVSRFFQPDLDQHPNRPGKGSFPFGQTVTNAIISFFGVLSGSLTKRSKSKYLANLTIYGPIVPISLAWYHLWTPYALLLTHRGLSHWPIIGTLSRIGYLHLLVLILEGITMTKFPALSGFLTRFYFWKGVSPEFFLYCAPVFISDIFHSAGDLTESLIKGYSFCPPAIKGGWIAKITGIRI